jgi:hypothetical protein
LSPTTKPIIIIIIIIIINVIIIIIIINDVLFPHKKLRGRSPQVNYTDLATATFWRS